MLASLVFISTVLQVKYVFGNGEHLINSASIAISYYGMTTMASNVSGGSLNPMISFIQIIFQDLITTFKMHVPNPLNPKTKTGIHEMWVYLIAPIIGGLLAALR